MAAAACPEGPQIPSAKWQQSHSAGKPPHRQRRQRAPGGTAAGSRTEEQAARARRVGGVNAHSPRVARTDAYRRAGAAGAAGGGGSLAPREGLARGASSFRRCGRLFPGQAAARDLRAGGLPALDAGTRAFRPQTRRPRSASRKSRGNAPAQRREEARTLGKVNTAGKCGPQASEGRITEWLTFDNMHHQWLLLAACFWVIFMFMVASKFITLTFKDPDAYSAKQEFLFLTAMPDSGKLQGEQQFPEELKPTGKMLSDGQLVQPLVYMERLELIQNVCRDEALKNLSHTAVSKFVLDRIFVCDKHKILFCQTPKVGNTQWKKVLIVLNGAFPSIEDIPENVVHDHEKNGLPRLSAFSDAEIQKRLETYFKFFIVRDPFERLISAFKDKFVHNPRFEPWYRHEIAPGIIRKYRRNRTETRGIQFEDFVRYLGDPNHRWLDLQFGDHIIHWVTYVELCAPCEISYSVIGHHETLEDDAPYILKEAGIDHLVSYPTIPPGITVYNKTKVEQYFLGISKRDIRRLYARFEGDFKLFGYQKPDFLLN